MGHILSLYILARTFHRMYHCIQPIAWHYARIPITPPYQGPICHNFSHISFFILLSPFYLFCSLLFIFNIEFILEMLLVKYIFIGLFSHEIQRMNGSIRGREGERNYFSVTNLVRFLSYCIRGIFYRHLIFTIFALPTIAPK